MINVDRLLMLADHMDRVPEENFEMREYYTDKRSRRMAPTEEVLPTLTPDALRDPGCGTAACVAGHAVVLFRVEVTGWQIATYARDALGLDAGQAHALFYGPWDSPAQVAGLLRGLASGNPPPEWLAALGGPLRWGQGRPGYGRAPAGARGRPGGPGGPPRTVFWGGLPAGRLWGRLRVAGAARRGPQGHRGGRQKGTTMQQQAAVKKLSPGHYEVLVGKRGVGTYIGGNGKREAEAHARDINADAGLKNLDKKTVMALMGEVDDLAYLVSEGIEPSMQRRHLKKIRALIKKIKD